MPPEAFHELPLSNLPALVLEEGEPLRSVRAYLQGGMASIRRAHESGASGDEVVAARTRLIDRLLATLFDRYARGARGAVLLALGGYGRMELAPGSDIDLLCLLAPDAHLPEGFPDRMLYLLWDCGLDLGWSIRDVEGTLDLAGTDSTVRTSLLDLRYLRGEATLVRRFRDRLLQAVCGEDPRRFILEKLAEQGRRHGKYAGSVYLLEPNLKEGEGGLRDLHLILWTGRAKARAETLRGLVDVGLLRPKELPPLLKARSFLWRVRNELHFHTGRRTDQLTFDLQQHVARFLGYRDTRRGLGVESFMEDYYSHASLIRSTAAEVVERAAPPPGRPAEGSWGQGEPLGGGLALLQGMIGVADPQAFRSDPVNLFRVFAAMRRTGADLSSGLRTAVKGLLETVDDEVRKSPRASEVFLEIAAGPRRVADTFFKMHELGLLGRYLPEFARVTCKVQHDVYHVFTVDMHLLFALRAAEALVAGEHAQRLPLLTSLAQEVKDLRALYLGVLFHDIGKGEGHGHVPRGTRLARRIADRSGFPEDLRDRVVFLVENHLLLAMLAFRRDIHDAALARRLADQVGDLENLKMLFILTFADLQAVGPEAWTDWKGSLLADLYEATAAVLTGNPAPSGEEARSEARRLLSKDYPAEEIDRHFALLPLRYFRSTPPQAIAAHMRLKRSLAGRAAVVQKVDLVDRGYSEVYLATADAPGLMTRVTGVFSAHNVNILSAWIQLQGDATVLDTYRVTYLGGPLLDPERWTRVAADLEAVLEGRLSVDALLAARRPSVILKGKVARVDPPRVEVDNDVSDECTVLDVYTQDRIGLLHAMTHRLTEMGLNIALAKISTNVDQVADTFYVTELHGRKIKSKDRLKEIREGLLAAARPEGGT